MVKLSNMYSKLKGMTLLDEYVLLEDTLFFNDELGKYNQFSIDDKEELEDLKSLLNDLQHEFKDLTLYIWAYDDELTDYKGDKCIYADCIWLNSSNSNLTIEYLNSLFNKYKGIEPSDISKLVEIDEYDQEHFYLFKSDGNIIDLKKNSRKKDFDNVIILYWD